ncbi:MAG TPA: ABC transporter permease [Chthoniobacterales bacterium]
MNDLRFALRQLVRQPGFTIVAVLALALGIGANTAIFSVTNAVLLRALPYKNPDRIMAIEKVRTQEGLGGLVAGSYFDFREQSSAFESFAAYDEEEFTLTGGGEPERVLCSEVSPSLFPLLGVEPSLGRGFRPEEEQPGHDQEVVVSQQFWQRRAGGDPRFIGKAITLNDRSYTVVGIMPAGFRFPHAFDIWKPLALDPVQERHGQQFQIVQQIARLKPNVSRERAEAELNTIWQRETWQGPEDRSGEHVQVRPLHETLVQDVRIALFVLLGAVGFVLLIACANVANLMLARAAERRREFAIRAAVGASRRRLVRQLLTESVLLSLAGGALGLLLALWGVDLLVANIPAEFAGTIYGLHGVAIDRGVLFFTFGVSIATGVLFGLAPAISSSRLDLNAALKATAKTASGRSRLRGSFVVAQIALTLVLLVGAGLMTRSFVRLLNVKLGFEPRHVLTVRVELPTSRYGHGAQRTLFFNRLLERLQNTPGVETVGAISQLPLSGYSMMGRFAVEGQPPTPEEKLKPIPIGVVTPGYFAAMKIPLLRGRIFNVGDSSDRAEVALVNAAFARKFWPNENPIGKKIGMGCLNSLCRTVVGVVGDIRHEGLADEPQPETYAPQPQFPLNSMSLILRTQGDPLRFVPLVRDRVRALDKDQPIALVQTLEDHVSASILQPRLITSLLGVFAGLALLLAAIGVYAMMSYTIAQRTDEIGIRMALGAMRSSIFGLVVRQAMTLVVLGVGLGLAGAFAATRLLNSLLYGVGVYDPLTFCATALLLAVLGFLAAWLPARRATRVDPMEALRNE